MNSNIPHASVLLLFSKFFFIELQTLIKGAWVWPLLQELGHHRVGPSPCGEQTLRTKHRAHFGGRLLDVMEKRNQEDILDLHKAEYRDGIHSFLSCLSHLPTSCQPLNPQQM